MTKDYLTMRVRCEKVANRYRNWNPNQAATCVMADAADQAAFWITEQFGGTVGNVAWLACANGELNEALAQFSTDMDPPRQEILDALIPLNHEAVLQLRMAYMSINQYPRIPTLWDRQEKRVIR